MRLVAETADIDLLINGHDHSDGYSGQLFANAEGREIPMVNGGGQELTRTVFRFTEDENGALEWELLESANLDPAQYDVDTELLVLNAHAFSQLSKQNVHVECCMYKLATERFSDVMWSMQQLLFTSFDKRLAQHLWDESQQGRESIHATHEQLAKDTGAVRETVTRMLRSFAEDGMVKLGRGTVTITDRDKMKKLALM